MKAYLWQISYNTAITIDNLYVLIHADDERVAIEKAYALIGDDITITGVFKAI